jgi:RsiW-degrading membrane proteinase PrsW (M82 family)
VSVSVVQDGAPARELRALRAGGFLQPRRPAFWLYLVLLVGFGAQTLLGYGPKLVEIGPVPALAAVGLIVLWTLPLLWFIRRLDLFEKEPVSLLVAAFVWGAVIAIGIAGRANGGLDVALAKLDPDLQEIWGAALSGPTTEEPLKALGVVMVVLIARHKFDRLLDGMVYGALAGLGFQAFEDFAAMIRDVSSDDLASALQTVGGVFLQRSILDGLWTHAVWTALVGLGIAYWVTRPTVSRWRRLTVLAGLFLVAWLFHFIHNGPAIRWPRLVGIEQSGPVAELGLPYLGILVNALLTLALAITLYRRAQREEYHWFESVLADDVGTELITREEAETLRTLRLRRRARSAIRRARGRDAARVMARVQREQIAYAVAKARGPEPAALAELERSRTRIRDLRRRLASYPDRARQGPQVS